MLGLYGLTEAKLRYHRDVTCTHGALLSLQQVTCFCPLDFLIGRDFSSVWQCWSVYPLVYSERGKGRQQTFLALRLKRLGTLNHKRWAKLVTGGHKGTTDFANNWEASQSSSRCYQNSKGKGCRTQKGCYPGIEMRWRLLDGWHKPTLPEGLSAALVARGILSSLHSGTSNLLHQLIHLGHSVPCLYSTQSPLELLLSSQFLLIPQA